MPEFSDLAIPQPSNPMTIGEWQGAINKFNELVIGINNGLTTDGITLGKSTQEVKYPWDYETVGVSKKVYNLRLQSPNSIYFHTGKKSQNASSVTVKEQLALMIKDNGNVGIGTGTPEKRLHIVSNIPNNGPAPLKIQTNFGFVEIGARNNGWAHFQTDKPKFYFNKGIRAATGQLGSYKTDLRLMTDDNERIRVIKATGNVGIGTTTPKVRLHVNGNRIRVDNGGKHLDLRADGGALDIESSKELFINNNGQKVFIRNLYMNQGVETFQNWDSGHQWKKSISLESDHLIMFKSGNSIFGIGGKVMSDGLNTSTQPKFVITAHAKPAILVNEWGETAIKGGLRLGADLNFHGGKIHGLSDVRLKKDVADLNFSLEKFLQLRPVNFKFNGKLGVRSKEQEVGLIAQEVQKYFPSLVNSSKAISDEENSASETDDFLSIASSSLIYYAIAAIKELNNKIEQLKQTNQ